MDTLQGFTYSALHCSVTIKCYIIYVSVHHVVVITDKCYVQYVKLYTFGALHCISKTRFFGVVYVQDVVDQYVTFEYVTWCTSIRYIE